MVISILNSHLEGKRVPLTLDLFDAQVISLPLAHNLLLHPDDAGLKLGHVVALKSLVPVRGFRV
jgi:hypothetical protein